MSLKRAYLSLLVGALLVYGQTCPSCNRDQCRRAKCVIGPVPYACLAGELVDGCAANPFDPKKCTECCKVDNCSITCGVCDKETCSTTNCPPNAPYTCSSGEAKGGCGAAATWTNNRGCDACCNTISCLPPTSSPMPFSCGNCTRAQCVYANCAPGAAPYACVRGKAAGGCAKTPDAWKNTDVCEECCRVIFV